MACERCGGHGTAVAGRLCGCQLADVGRVAPVVGPAPGPGAWIIRETWYGRWTTLSYPQKAGATLALTAVIAGLLLTSVSFFSGTRDTGADRAAGTGLRDVPKPTLILPTGYPALPGAHPSATGSSQAGPPPGRPGGESTGPEHPAPAKKPTSVPRAPVTYSAWTGPGCVTSAYAGYYEEGRYSDGIEGWYTVGSGGWAGGHCDGSFAAVPMSGSRTRDRDNSATWWWSVGPDSDECELGVYVPEGSSRDVGGDPTTYRMVTEPENGEPESTIFRIDQTVNRGRLVDAGTYRAGGGRIEVTLLDRGQDWDDDGPTYAHHAAAQMKITCRAEGA